MTPQVATAIEELYELDAFMEGMVNRAWKTQNLVGLPDRVHFEISVFIDILEDSQYHLKKLREDLENAG